MIRLDWDELRRNLLGDPSLFEEPLDLAFESWLAIATEKRAGWIAEEAFRMGLQQASLALA